MNEEAMNFQEEFEQKWNEYQEKHKLYPNIMILGRTGVGKSSLINRIFGREIAPVSDVKPQTQEFDDHYGDDHGLFVNFIDSKGYEINDDAPTSQESMTAFINKVKNEINHRYKQTDKQVHILWYCISVAEHRIEPLDCLLIENLSRIEQTKGRIAVVLTKCDQDDESGSAAIAIKETIDKLNVTNVPVFEVSTDPTLPLELGELIPWSLDALGDQDLKDNFVASQMISLDEKKLRAKKYINAATAAAAGVGAVPISFSDSALLVPIQMTMIVGIINVYGIQSLANISKQVVSDIIISNIGKSIAGNIIKLIPVAGQVVGGIINATVASAITKAIGEACSCICYKACEDIMKGKNVDFENMFDFDLIMDLVKNIMTLEKDNE